MINQTMIFTALPNGIEADSLRLSVYIAPRLWTQDRAPRKLSLDQFPDFLDFPKQVESMTFTVEFSNGTRIEGLRRANSEPLRADMWQVLFRQPPAVETYPQFYPYRYEAESLANARFDTFPIAQLHLALREFYAGVEGIADEIRNVDAPQGATLAALRAALDAVEPAAEPTDAKDLLDFHQMLSLLGSYPELLRSLGLVVDLHVPLNADIPRDEDAMVRVLPHWTPKLTATHTFSPRTHYQLTNTRFIVKARPESDLQAGLYRLNDETRFQFALVDLIGASLRAITINELPPLRSTGISIIRANLAEQLKEQARRADALNRALSQIDGSYMPSAAGMTEPLPATDELYAEDVMRGFRADVWDSTTNKWYSLHQRTSIFYFVGITGTKIRVTDEKVSEGFAQIALREVEHGKRVIVHETLLNWDGWSLSAPRPGLPQTETDSALIANEPLTQFGLEVVFKAHRGSLPRLRFSRTYRLRLRGVDLAGNSVFGPESPEFAETQDLCSPEITFSRHEALPLPVLMLRSTPVEGESVDTIVVRSGLKPSSTDIARSERHFAPPRASLRLAEWHAALDVPESYSLIARDQMPDPDAITEDGFLVQPNLDYSISYLPDPLARGVVFYGLPGLPEDEPFRVAFEGAFPDIRPFRLRVVAVGENEPIAPPEYGARIPGAASGLLAVQIRPSERYTVRYATYTDADSIAAHGLNDWTDAAEVLLSPTAVLTLTHAVAQPLKAPQFVEVQANRAYGESSVHLSGKIELHSPSSGKVDILAHWQDMVDDPSLPSPIIGEERTRIISAAADFKHVVLPLDDFKFREITLTPLASSAFREMLDAAQAEDPQQITRPTPEEIKQGVGAHKISVLNSTRPNPPRLAYLIPSFAWDAESVSQNSDGGAHISVTRRGKSVRVYLERGWYSSGSGEMLAAIFAARPFSEIPPAQQVILTHWTTNPTFGGELPTQAPLASHFLNTTPVLDLGIPELPQLPLGIAPYSVSYDAARTLWYADVTLDPLDAYFPLVRLALARYQPNSVAGAHLSPIVMSDYVPLSPDRRVEVVIGSDKASLEVAIHGISYAAGASLPKRHMDVRLERQRSDLVGDLAWETAAFTLTESVHTHTQWQGSLKLNEPYQAGKFRLKIIEAEPLADDGVRGEGLITVPRVVFAYLKAF
ncbi:MAG: hypothetical protein OHK0023_17440 [Anaerolineae bacterium]